METSAKVIWKEGLSFTGINEKGFTVPLAARTEVGGEENGLGPMELIAIGLAGCTAMDVISILQKKRQAVTAFEVRVRSPRAEEHPKVFTSTVIEYIVSGQGIEEAAVVRAIELSVTRYCPAHAMFQKVMPIFLEYQIYEEDGKGERVKVTEGKYTHPEVAG
jgi:putative redox protein